MANKRSEDYWIKRAVLAEEAAQRDGDELLREMRHTYERGTEEIQGKIDALYRKYEGKYGLSYADAIEKLTPAEQKAWQNYETEYVRRMADPARYPNAEQQYDVLSTRVRVSRLEALKTEIDTRLDGMARDMTERGEKALGIAYNNARDRTLFDIAQWRGEGQEIKRLSPERIQEIVNYPWSGAGFSERVWKNRDLLGRALKEELTQGLIRGDGHAQIALRISQKMDVGFKVADRLVRTELNRIFNQARIDGYKKSGIEKYRFLATLDALTCPECGALDKKEFDVDDAKTGVNLAPIHPNDRCSTEPVLRAALEAGRTRWAYGENNKGYRVPADMTYEEWRKERDEEGRLTGKESKNTEPPPPVKGGVYGLDGTLPEVHAKAIEGILDGAEPNVSALWRKHADKIKFSSLTDKDARYTYNTGTISLDLSEGPTDVRGAYGTLFHEVGHLLDHKVLGNASVNAQAFASALKEDYNKLIETALESLAAARSHKPSMEEVYAYISEGIYQLGGARTSGLSDMLSGLSGNRINAGFGHRESYWRHKGNIELESFAQVYQAACQNGEKLTILRTSFPKTYAVFLRIVIESL